MADLNELTEQEYHRHPALSASGAKVLIREGGPARYRQMMDSPSERKREFDIGHAVHSLVLGVGATPVAVEGNRNANAVKERIAEVEAAGGIALKPDDFDTIAAMAEAMKAHPVVAELLSRDGGVAEDRVQWTDQHGTPWRGMLDFHAPGLVLDLKTAASVDSWDFARAMSDYGYHLQAATYIEAAKRALGYQDPEFLLVAQEKKPPYLVSVFEPDFEALQQGAILMRRAASIYRACMASGEWPGIEPKVHVLGLPPYYDFEDEMQVI